MVFHDRPVRLGSFKQRALLAALGCRAGSAVSVDRLTETLWGDDPPRTATKNLQVYVWHLRQLLGQEGAPGRLLYAPPGYRLELRPGELDLDRFERDVREARAAVDRGYVELATERFASALGLWQGQALADLLAAPTLQAESTHLEEVRAGVVEDRFDAELALGRQNKVIGAIDSAIRTHPFRERLRVQQIQALYLAGRQGEALAAYDAVRRLLAQELGLQPSPQLQRLQELILGGRPLEGLPTARTGTVTGTVTGRGRRVSAPAPVSTYATVPAPDIGAIAAAAHPVEQGDVDVEAHTGRSRPSRFNGNPHRATGPSDPADGPVTGPVAGPVAETAAETAAATAEAPVTRWTHRLPRTVRDFTGREQELEHAVAAVRTKGASLLVVTGPIGAGKSAFAIHLAHLLEHDYVDGQLSVDLSTPDGSPRPSYLVLASLLRAVGAGPDPSLDDTGELAGMLRARIAPLRVLILLDSAHTEAQVRPLLPGTGRSLTLVTSRSRLAGLEAAEVIHTGRFTRSEGLRLLENIIGTERIRAEHAAAERIVDTVDRLPLAVRIAGARLAARPDHSLSCYAARLADPRRLARELTAGDLSIADRLHRAYRHLPAAEARALRLLCAAAGPVAPEHAGAWLDLPTAEAEVLLERLTDLHLAEAEYDEEPGGPHRYRPTRLVAAVLQEQTRPGEFPGT